VIDFPPIIAAVSSTWPPGVDTGFGVGVPATEAVSLVQPAAARRVVRKAAHISCFSSLTLFVMGLVPLLAPLRSTPIKLFQILGRISVSLVAKMTMNFRLSLFIDQIAEFFGTERNERLFDPLP
jgi:hypothetical protein